MNLIFSNSFYSNLMTTGLNLLSGNLKVALLNSAYVFDGNGHLFLNQVLPNEVTGAGYTSGGQAVSGTSKVVVPATTMPPVLGSVQLQASNNAWTTVTVTARYAVLYYWTGDPTTSPLIGLYDFGSNQMVSAGNFTLQWDVTGVLYFQ